MSERNVDVVQRFFAAVERLLETWETSRSLLDAMKAGDIPPEAREALGKQIALERLGSAQDIAAIVAFLASDLASYITGQVFVVDGGMVM